MPLFYIHLLVKQGRCSGAHQEGKGHSPEDTTCDRATVLKGAIHVETVAIVSDSRRYRRDDLHYAGQWPLRLGADGTAEEASTEAIATFSPSPLVFTSLLVDAKQAYKDGGKPIARRSSLRQCRGLQDDPYRIPPLTNIR